MSLRLGEHAISEPLRSARHELPHRSEFFAEGGKNKPRRPHKKHPGGPIPRLPVTPNRPNRLPTAPSMPVGTALNHYVRLGGTGLRVSYVPPPAARRSRYLFPHHLPSHAGAHCCTVCAIVPNVQPCRCLPIHFYFACCCLQPAVPGNDDLGRYVGDRRHQGREPRDLHGVLQGGWTDRPGWLSGCDCMCSRIYRHFTLLSCVAGFRLAATLSTPPTSTMRASPRRGSASLWRRPTTVMT